jgi:group II intron reverse transcriptase/maturase
MILEAIYEPTFSSNSHGFRVGKSPHTALRQTLQQFQPATWIIEGDFAKCFDSIPHDRLMQVLEEKIRDRQFTNLIAKSLGAGYMQFRRFASDIVGTPQGSIISPILANIYLHQVDVFVEDLKRAFDRGTRAKNTKEAERLMRQLTAAQMADNVREAARLRKLVQSQPVMDYHDTSYRRLVYIRYADDWLIGVRGSYAEASEIRDKVCAFCKDKLGLTVHQEKTKITNIIRERAVFLGVEVFRSKVVKYSRVKRKGEIKPYKQRQNRKLVAAANLDRIRSKLISCGFLSDRDLPTPRFLWLHLQHRHILHMYNSVMRGYLNYYSFALNYSTVARWLRWVMYTSAAKLLSAKFKRSVRATFLKFGRTLKDPHSQSEMFRPRTRYTGEFNIKAVSTISGLYAGYKSVATLDG